MLRGSVVNSVQTVSQADSHFDINSNMHEVTDSPHKVTGDCVTRTFNAAVSYLFVFYKINAVEKSMFPSIITF